MKAVNPDELVAEVHLGEHQTRQDEVDGKEPLRQDVGVFLTGDITPAGEQCQHAGQGPANGAVVVEDVSRGAIGIGETGFDLAEDDGDEDRNSGDDQVPEADLKQVLLSGNDSDQIEDDGDQRHRDDEMHDDRVDDVEPGEVFVVERGKKLEHRQAERHATQG